MNLRHLRYFVALADRLNFTAAARHLGIAQPPLSVQIRNLEQEVGGALFHREQRRIRLTPLGLLMLDEARSLLAQADRAADRIRDAAEGRAGEVRLACTRGALSERVTRRLRKFIRKNRGVRLQAERISYRAAQSGCPGPWDVLITEALAQPEDGFAIERGRIEIAVPPKHRLAHRTELTAPDLLGEMLWMSSPEHRSPLEHHISQLVDDKILTVDIALAPADFSDRLWQVSLGLGSAVCSSLDRDVSDAIRLPLAETPEVVSVCRANPDSRATALAALLAAIRE